MKRFNAQLINAHQSPCQIYVSASPACTVEDMALLAMRTGQPEVSVRAFSQPVDKCGAALCPDLDQMQRVALYFPSRVVSHAYYSHQPLPPLIQACIRA